MIPVLPPKRVYNKTSMEFVLGATEPPKYVYNKLYGVLHHRGERDAEPTHLEEHGRVGLLAEAIEADARGPEKVHAVDDDRVLVQNLIRDEEIRHEQRRRSDVAKNIIQLGPALALLRGAGLGRRSRAT